MDPHKVKQIIKEALPDAQVEVQSPDGRHYEAIVTSPSFKGKMLVEQHQMVLAPLRQALQGGLHAISIKTKVPD